MGNNNDKKNGQHNSHKFQSNHHNNNKLADNGSKLNESQQKEGLTVYKIFSRIAEIFKSPSQSPDSCLLYMREAIQAEITKQKDLTHQIEQLNNELSNTRNALKAVKEDNEKVLSTIQNEIGKLQSELNDKIDLIHYLEKQTGGEAVKKVHELQKQVKNLSDEVVATVEKAVKSIISINGDVGAFSDKFLGKCIYCYPESNEIVLKKADPDEIRLFDLMGVEFPPDKESLQCTVVQKGWRDSNKVWIEAKLSIRD